MVRPLRPVLRLFAFLFLIGIMLVECKKGEDTPVTPTPQPSTQIKPGENVGLGANLLPKEAYQALPLLKDPLVGARIAADKLPNLPATYELTANMPPVDNQGMQGSCTAWAVAYAARSYFNKVAKQANYTAPDGKPNQEALFSPAFVYNQVKVNGCANGSSIKDALDLLQTAGVCSLKDMPYSETDCSTQPTAEQKQKAAAYKIKKWARINISPATFRRFLYFDYPIIFASTLDNNFMRLKEKDASGDYIWKSYDASSASGGHAMVLVGYDDQKKAFKLQNSWSDRWANKGYLWLSYDIVERAVQEAYVMVAGDNADLKVPTVETGTATKINEQKVDISGSIKELGGAAVIRYGIQIGVGNLTDQSTKIEAEKAISTLPFAFTVVYAGTSVPTQFSYRAYIETPEGIFYGQIKAYTNGSIDTKFNVICDPLPQELGRDEGLYYNNNLPLKARVISTGLNSFFSDHGFILVQQSARQEDTNLPLDKSPRYSLGAINNPTTFQTIANNLKPAMAYLVYAYLKTSQGQESIYGVADGSSTKGCRYQTPPSIIYSGNSSVSTVLRGVSQVAGAATYSSINKTFYLTDGGGGIYQMKDGQTSKTLFAGINGFSTNEIKDGKGEAARFKGVSKMAADNQGNIFVVDNGDLIRRITVDGTVTTIAGGKRITSGSDPAILDGKGDQARFSTIVDMTIDTQNTLWVIDLYTIRKITPDGAVTTYCGNRTSRQYADGSLATATFYNPVSIAADQTNNLYVLDKNRVRKISSSGVTSVAGRSIYTQSDGKDVIQFDQEKPVSHYVDGQLPSVDFWNPTHLLIDRTGVLYVVDLYRPGGSGGVLNAPHFLRRIDADGRVTTLAGKPEWITSDGVGKNAGLFRVEDMFWHNDELYIIDYGVLKKVTL
ncbi:C1 family peptidase [Spirosoma soli]|uniref:C1 family peptidase n=1 Tax=Spirosoma soli TaxID=1770529 RepID=A0ABW5M9A9_9BACT